MIEFLGKYSLATGIERLSKLVLEELVSQGTLVVVPSAQVKEQLSVALNPTSGKNFVESPNVKILTDFEAALTFFEGKYPLQIVRQMLCLRVLGSKEGEAAFKQIFPHRELGVSQARVLLELFDELFELSQSASVIAAELTRIIHPESVRWNNLAVIERCYLAELAKEGFDFKLSNRKVKVILFGNIKISPLLKKLIANCDLKVLVFSKPEKSQYFNQFGEIIDWEEEALLPANQFVPTPRDYLGVLKQTSKEDECGVLLFDEVEKRVVTQALAESGYLVEVFESTSVKLIIELVNGVLAAFSSERLFDLFSLLRITAVQELLAKEISSIPKMGLVTAIDQYQMDRLQLSWTSSVLPEGKNLNVALETLGLLKKLFIFPLKSANNIGAVARVISTWIETLYPMSTDVITEINQVVDELPSDLVSQDTSCKLILNFILTREKLKIRPGKVKLFSSLQSAYFSDTRDLIILGPVVGRIPKSGPSSVFLNPGILKVLKIKSTDITLEKYLLSCLSPRVKSVLIPKLNLSGESTSISSLFYPKEPEAIAREILRFYDSSEEKPTRNSVRTEVIHQLPKHDLSSLRKTQGESLIRLSVTALDFYASSPFKFYIERVLKAAPLSDDRRELEPNQFGDLAHFVLKALVKLSKDSTLEEITLLLENELDKVANDIYGTNLSAAIETQFYNLKERLRTYAKYEMKSLEEGWQIIASEVSSKPYLIRTTKESIELSARIDRIDFNAKVGAYRIWDYKTGDNTKSIFKKDGSVVSLQLPLYALFLAQGLVCEFKSGAPIEVGYIALGSMVSEPKANLVSQTQLEEALSQAKQVAENLVNCRFELGESEKVHSSSDFSMFLDYQGIAFDEEQGDEAQGES